MATNRTFSFNVVDPNADWVAQWLAANPVGGAAWTGRWTTSAVNFDAVAPSGLYVWHNPNANGASPRPTEEELLAGAPLDYYTASYVFEDEQGGHMLDWDGPFEYDPATGLHIVGGSVGSSASYYDAPYKTWYVRYDPRSNQWFKRHNPAGIGTGHHYSAHAMDRIGRKFYRGGFQFDMDNEALPMASVTGAPSVNFGGTVSQAFHEVLGRMYWIGRTGLYLWWQPSPRTSSNGTGGSGNLGVQIGDYPVAAYHSALGCVILGGGSSGANNVYTGNRKLFKVDSAGTISMLADEIPDPLYPIVASTTNKHIIDVGLPDAFVVIPDHDRTPPAVALQNTWLFRPNAAAGQQWTVSQDAWPTYMKSWGGYQHLSMAGIPHLGLVMVMWYDEGNSNIAPTPIDQRRCKVYFYKPSGA